MSTEKDREIAKYYSKKHYFESIDDIEEAVLFGIQHARQGERELLNGFANKLVTEIYEAVNQRRKANDVDIIIDEFLEQEKSK